MKTQDRYELEDTRYRHAVAAGTCRFGCPASVLAVPVSEVAVINVEEQMTGWQLSLRCAKTDTELVAAYAKLAASVRVLSGMQILGFSELAMTRYNSLLAMKLNAGKMDLRIAAIALEEGVTVVTRNLRDFQRVPELICENWAD